MLIALALGVVAICVVTLGTPSENAASMYYDVDFVLPQDTEVSEADHGEEESTSRVIESSYNQSRREESGSTNVSEDDLAKQLAKEAYDSVDF